MGAQAERSNLRPSLPGAFDRKSRLLAERWVEVSFQDTRGRRGDFRKFCAARTQSNTTTASVALDPAFLNWQVDSVQRGS